METDNQNGKAPHPEKTGKVPASGVISETYKEELNPQDILGSLPDHALDPDVPEKDTEDDFDTDPLEEGYTFEEGREKGSNQNNEFDNDDGDIEPSNTNEDDFLK